VALASLWVMLSQSINAYSATSAPLLGTSQFRRRAAYMRCLRCAGAPMRPRAVPCFRSPFCLDMSSSTTPGSSTAAHTQFLRRRRWPSSRRERLGTPNMPHNPLPVGAITELNYGSLALRPVEWIATPFSYGSYILHFMPVYPGALRWRLLTLRQLLLPNRRPVRGCPFPRPSP
jgi:hypothetical protein